MVDPVQVVAELVTTAIGSAFGDDHVADPLVTILGDALARVLAWRGHTVIRQNHLGDWGTPLGMLYEHAAGERELTIGCSI